MHDDRKLQTVGLWLLDLLELTKGGREPPTPHKIALYTEQLADMFPVGAFTKGSLRAVVFEQEYFPAFDLVRARVRQWWNENMPSTGTLIAFDGGPKLDAMDQSWVRFYYKRRGEISMTENDIHPKGSAERANTQIGILESLIRARSPKGWESITGVNPEMRRDATEAEKDAVARVLGRVFEGVTS